ncbi:BT4734/BF3469 family protein [Flavilitoribacter nigricans]|uniref:VirE protein n=1 Tax=Flavilitoribacter nigricans (strain ATCC 23147 / DSM 23189 / NBRC 102662 / NCIMB 1420 / SS-2) TaxID=1122177 RepID=A0A2D0MXS5_FLAN2|nr:BT4734/BF3469 family protein [Flavilitoribacter nigricans]PHN00926.1 VirE protein [Flavilitoribacter nigricans DSM 23189 = NBRC 102662]
MKRSVLDIEVSCFRSYEGRKPDNVNLLTWLTSDKYADQVKELRQLDDKAERDRIKATLPAITVSGIFAPSRKEENLVKHSGLICIDIDPKGNENIANFMDLKQELFKIRNVAFAGLSVSGKGFFLIIPIACPKRHKQHFQAIYHDLLNYGITIDLAPQNVASLRGYSYDPEPLFRHDAIPYRKWGRPQPQKTPRHSVHFSPSRHVIGTQEKVEALIQQIVERQIDITTEEPDWFRLACALANEFGESGRSYFHAISQFYCKYDIPEADKKFSHALTGRYRQITIGTFFKLVSQSTL